MSGGTSKMLENYIWATQESNKVCDLSKPQRRIGMNQEIKQSSVYIVFWPFFCHEIENKTRKTRQTNIKEKNFFPYFPSFFHPRVSWPKMIHPQSAKRPFKDLGFKSPRKRFTSRWSMASSNRLETLKEYSQTRIILDGAGSSRRHMIHIVLSINWWIKNLCSTVMRVSHRYIGKGGTNS